MALSRLEKASRALLRAMQLHNANCVPFELICDVDLPSEITIRSTFEEARVVLVGMERHARSALTERLEAYITLHSSGVPA